nr:uncharacterized protein LOC127307016 [Lolium perenne]
MVKWCKYLSIFLELDIQQEESAVYMLWYIVRWLCSAPLRHSAGVALATAAQQLREELSSNQVSFQLCKAWSSIMQLVVAESSRQIPRGPFGVVGRSKMLNLGRPHGRLNIMANWVLLIESLVLCILLFFSLSVSLPAWFGLSSNPVTLL